MARKIINRAELKAAAEAAEAERAKTQRANKRQQTPVVHPAFRPLKLDDSLLTTYFAWCPIDLMPEVNLSSRDPMVRGRLTLRMKQLGGLREQWDLVGESGWLVMDAVWLDSHPPEQYLICAARAFKGRVAGRVVSAGHLWRLWQPSFEPQFLDRRPDAGEPSDEMRAAVEDTLKQHLAESVKAWVERAQAIARGRLESDLAALTTRVEELDAARRALRRSASSTRMDTSAIRQELIAAEARMAELSEALATAEPPLPSLRRQRLCEVEWVVKSPDSNAL
jgi:hypothetical protein